MNQIPSATPIFNLNSFCLNSVFQQIKISCDWSANNCNDNLVKYLDLINFVTCCQSFIKAFKVWSPDLYVELKLQAPLKEIDLSKVYGHMKGLTANGRKAYWADYLKTIKSNDTVEFLKIISDHTRYNYPDHLDMFDDVIKALTDKITLQKLFISNKGYGFQSVPQLSHLKTLHLDMRIDAHDLVQLCKLNPNLRTLKLGFNSEITGKLSNIVPHCKQLENLSFMIPFGTDGAEYAPLANLPRLRELTLMGVHQEGSLLELFQNLKQKMIKRICIPNTYVSNEEALALGSIQFLASLKCCLRDTSIYEALPLSFYLVDLCILVQPFQHGHQAMPEDTYERNYLKMTVRGLPLSDQVPDTFLQSMRSGDPGLLPKAWSQDYVNGLRHRFEGWFKANFLPDTIQILKEKVVFAITKIVVFEPISQDDLAMLASISTLRNSLTIKLPFSQIREMIAVKLQQLDGSNFTAKRVDRVRTEHCEARLIHGLEFVTLVLVFFEKDISINARIFTPLVTLKNLKRLEIKMNTVNGSLVALFKSFVSMEKHTLQELKVAFLSPEEVAEVAKIRSLKVIECGFSCSRNIDHLAALNQLELLTITVHPLGSLEALFKALALKKDPTLRVLIIQRIGLTFEEVSELAGIESLTILQLGLPSVQNWQEKCGLPGSGSAVNLIWNLEPLAKLLRLKALSIYWNYQTSTLEKLLRTIARESPKRLQKLSLPSQYFGLISPLEGVECLECTVCHFRFIEDIVLLRNLTYLHIHDPLEISWWEVVKELKDLSSLQCLLLDEAKLEFLEIVEVTRLTWLKRLRLGLAVKKFIYMLLSLRDLEVLEITSEHLAEDDEPNFLLSFLVVQLSLRSISLYRFYNFIRKDYVDAALNHIKCFRDPKEHPPFKLRGIWSDFSRLSQLYFYNADYMELERVDGGYQSSDQSDDDEDNEI